MWIDIFGCTDFFLPYYLISSHSCCKFVCMQFQKGHLFCHVEDSPRDLHVCGVVGSHMYTG